MEERLQEEREKADFLKEKALFEQAKQLQAEYEVKLGGEMLGRIPVIGE